MDCKTSLERERIAKNICSELNNFIDLKSSITYVLTQLKEITKCEALGIRLQVGQDFPYYVHDGYTAEFIMSENSLCNMPEKDEVLGLSLKSSPELSCLCGSIINGNVDTEYDFFTEGGSFWASDFVDIIPILKEVYKNDSLRLRCEAQGYRTLALIPVRARGQILGLIQVCDSRVGAISQEIVELLEMIAQNIGLAFLNSRRYSELQEIVNLQEIIKSQKEKIKKTIEVEQSRSEFFLNISHEMGTPMNIILNSIKLIDKQIEKSYLIDSNGKTVKFSNMIKRNTFRMIRLINNLIDTTSIDNGFFKLNFSNCDIIKLLRETIIAVSGYLKTECVELEFNTQIEEKFLIIDPEKIVRILLNLISNAIKFSDYDGRVTISVREDTNLIISVKDQGIGIYSELTDRIFDRFYQIDKSLTRQHEGTGLGLYIVKSIITMHGGTIWVDSTGMKGSELIFTIPIKVDEQHKLKTYDVFENHESLVEKIKIEFSDIYKINSEV